MRCINTSLKIYFQTKHSIRKTIIYKYCSAYKTNNKKKCFIKLKIECSAPFLSEIDLVTVW